MTQPSCLAVMYHYVRDSAANGHAGIRALPPALFEQQLDWLAGGYTPIDIAELDAALDRPGSTAVAPPPAGEAEASRADRSAPLALLTFDDGFVDHYTTVLPILRQRQLTGVFFLAYDACGPAPRVLPVHKTHLLLAHLGAEAFVEQVLQATAAAAGNRGSAGVFGADGWEQRDERAVKDLLNYHLPFHEADRVLDALFERHIGSQEACARELYLSEPMIAEMARAGMTFGYHTRSHRMLSRLTAAEQEAELSDGVAWIRALTGQTRVPFCYPWGGRGTYTGDTLRILERSGYSLAFNTVRRRIDVGRDPRFELPRVDTRDLPPYTGGEPAPAPLADQG